MNKSYKTFRELNQEVRKPLARPSQIHSDGRKLHRKHKGRDVE